MVKYSEVERERWQCYWNAGNKAYTYAYARPILPGVSEQ